MREAVVRFGAFELDPGSGELRRQGHKVRIAPQPARLLCLLAARAGQLVTREEIRNHLWGADTFVDAELGLNYCLNAIRSALRDSARAPRFVETLPKRGYRFIAPVEVVRTSATKPTVVVLPFCDLSGDGSKEYFADGMADALITELGRVKSLRVISRQSTLHLKGTGKPLPEIGRELSADAVVEGSVLHSQGRVRINAQLVRTEPEEHLWAHSYERPMSDVLEIQREMAIAVAEHVQAVLTPGDLNRLPHPKPVNAAAYEAFLRGEFYLNRWSAENFRKALEYLGQALELDPGFAPAWTSLAYCYSLVGFWGHMPPQQAGTMAKEAAAKALGLDDFLAFAHAVRGWIALQYDWNFPLCDSETERALELSPSDLVAHSARAVAWLIRGNISEGIAETREILRLDPVSVYTNVNAAWFLVFARQFEQARLQVNKAIDMFPGALQPWYVLGWAETGLGRYEEAVTALEHAVAISRDAMSLGYLGHALARAGRKAAAEALLRELLERSCREYVPPKPLICLYAGLGDIDKAFEWIEKAYQDRDGVVLWLDMGIPFDPLRNDPRFGEMLNRLGLPPPRLPAILSAPVVADAG